MSSNYLTTNTFNSLAVYMRFIHFTQLAVINIKLANKHKIKVTNTIYMCMDSKNK